MPRINATHMSSEEFRQQLMEAMLSANPVDDLLELWAELRAFEEKYGMSSEEFYRAYMAGTLPDELQHCVKWAATYHMFIRIKRRIESALMQVAVMVTEERDEPV